VESLDGIRYRAATPRDALAVAKVVADGFATYRDFAPAGWRPRTAKQQETEIYTRLDRGDAHARLALSSATVAGFTGWMPVAARRPSQGMPAAGAEQPAFAARRAHLWSLFIAKRWWGSGLATELLAWSVEGMRDSGYASAQLWTPADHARARAFYEREGWTARGRRSFSPDLGLDLILYERLLA
jgi:GNAT superfamily N-acetyltransferase